MHRPITSAVLLLFALLLSAPASGSEKKTLVFSEIAGSSSGIIARTILQKAYAKLNIQVTGKPLPTARALHDSSTGVTDGEIVRIFAVGKTYTSLRRVEPHLMSMKGVAFVKGAPFPIEGPQSLRPFRIGIPLGIEYARRLFDDGTYDVVVLPDSDQLLRLLDKGRLDVVVMVRMAGLRRIRDMGLRDIHPLEPPLAELRLYHYLHEQHADLLPRIESVLREMRDNGELERIEQEVFERTGGHPAPY